MSAPVAAAYRVTALDTVDVRGTRPSLYWTIHATPKRPLRTTSRCARVFVSTSVHSSTKDLKESVVAGVTTSLVAGRDVLAEAEKSLALVQAFRRVTLVRRPRQETALFGVRYARLAIGCNCEVSCLRWRLWSRTSSASCRWGPRLRRARNPIAMKGR